MSRRLRQLVNERHPPPVHLRKIRHKLLTFLVPLRNFLSLSLPLQRKTLSLDKNLWRRKFFWKKFIIISRKSFLLYFLFSFLFFSLFLLFIFLSFYTKISITQEYLLFNILISHCLKRRV